MSKLFVKRIFQFGLLAFLRGNETLGFYLCWLMFLPKRDASFTSKSYQNFWERLASINRLILFPGMILPVVILLGLFIIESISTFSIKTGLMNIIEEIYLVLLVATISNYVRIMSEEMAYSGHQFYQKAITDFTEIINRDPESIKSIKAYYLRGIAKLGLDDREEGFDDFRKGQLLEVAANKLIMHHDSESSNLIAKSVKMEYEQMINPWLKQSFFYHTDQVTTITDITQCKPYFFENSLVSNFDIVALLFYKKGVRENITLLSKRILGEGSIPLILLLLLLLSTAYEYIALFFMFVLSCFSELRKTFLDSFILNTDDYYKYVRPEINFEIRINPESVKAYYFRAAANHALGWHKKGVADYQKVIELLSKPNQSA